MVTHSVCGEWGPTLGASTPSSPANNLSLSGTGILTIGADTDIPNHLVDVPTFYKYSVTMALDWVGGSNP